MICLFFIFKPHSTKCVYIEKTTGHSTGFELISGRLNLVFTVFGTRHGSRFQRACLHWCKFASKQSTPTRKSPTCPTSVRAKYPIHRVFTMESCPVQIHRFLGNGPDSLKSTGLRRILMRSSRPRFLMRLPTSGLPNWGLPTRRQKWNLHVLSVIASNTHLPRFRR